MSLCCNFPGCEKEFRVDCPLEVIVDHVEKAHGNNPFYPSRVNRAIVYLTIHRLIEESLIEQIKLDRRRKMVCRNFRAFWKLLEGVPK